MNLHNDKERFREAIIAASIMFGIEPSLVEKDYFVTLFLKESIKRIPGLVFKGRSGVVNLHYLNLLMVLLNRQVVE